MATLLPSLQRGSHSITNLTSCALAYIERDRQDWTASQRSAYEYLGRIFESDRDYTLLATQLKLRQNSARGSEIIEKIGDLFLLKELKGIDFCYHFDAAQVAQDAMIGETRMESPNAVTISVRFNTAHPLFHWADIEGQRKIFFSTLLHEAIHVFFFRFQPLSAWYKGTYHHHGFNMVAEAVERRAIEIFGVHFDLHRLNSFVHEIRATNEVACTDYQLKKRFGDRLVYHDEAKCLVNHGASMPGFRKLASAPPDGEPHEPLVGPARYPMWSKGPGRDLVLFDKPKDYKQAGIWTPTD